MAAGYTRAEERAAAAARGEAEPRDGIPTGLATLDAKLTAEGLPLGAITVLAGATSAGKSALAKTCVLGAAAAHTPEVPIPVAVVSLEDSAESFAARCIADLAQLENRAMQRAIVRDAEWRDVQAACARLAVAPISVLDAPCRCGELCAAIRSHVRQHGTRLIVVDFLQLVPADDGHRSESRTREVAEVMLELQRTSRACPGAAMLVVSQLRRRGDECPRREDLRWAGEIEQYAHTIGLLWRPALEGYGPLVALNIDKQKNGPTGIWALAWRPKTVSYRDPDDAHAVAQFEAAATKLAGGAS